MTVIPRVGKIFAGSGNGRAEKGGLNPGGEVGLVVGQYYSRSQAGNVGEGSQQHHVKAAVAVMAMVR